MNRMPFSPKLGPEDNPWLFAYTFEPVERPKGADDGG